MTLFSLCNRGSSASSGRGAEFVGQDIEGQARELSNELRSLRREQLSQKVVCTIPIIGQIFFVLGKFFELVSGNKSIKTQISDKITEIKSFVSEKMSFGGGFQCMETLLKTQGVIGYILRTNILSEADEKVFEGQLLEVNGKIRICQGSSAKPDVGGNAEKASSLAPMELEAMAQLVASGRSKEEMDSLNDREREVIVKLVAQGRSAEEAYLLILQLRGNSASASSGLEEDY